MDGAGASVQSPNFGSDWQTSGLPSVRCYLCKTQGTRSGFVSGSSSHVATAELLGNSGYARTCNRCKIKLFETLTHVRTQCYVNSRFGVDPTPAAGAGAAATAATGEAIAAAATAAAGGAIAVVTVAASVADTAAAAEASASVSVPVSAAATAAAATSGACGEATTAASAEGEPGEIVDTPENAKRASVVELGEKTSKGPRTLVPELDGLAAFLEDASKDYLQTCFVKDASFVCEKLATAAARAAAGRDRKDAVALKTQCSAAASASRCAGGGWLAYCNDRGECSAYENSGGCVYEKDIHKHQLSRLRAVLLLPSVVAGCVAEMRVAGEQESKPHPARAPPRRRPRIGQVRGHKSRSIEPRLETWECCESSQLVLSCEGAAALMWAASPGVVHTEVLPSRRSTRGGRTMAHTLYRSRDSGECLLKSPPAAGAGPRDHKRRDRRR